MLYVSRLEWGARRPKSIAYLQAGAQRGLAIHWEGSSGPVEHAKCAGAVRSIQDFHMDGRGWNDIAYSWLVCPHGIIFEGRGWGIRTAAQGTNAGNDAYHAACSMSGPGDPLTDPVKATLHEIAVETLTRFPGATEVRPHNFFHATQCPGPALTAWIAAGMPLPSPEVGMPNVPLPVGVMPLSLSPIVLPDGRQGYFVLASDGSVYAFGSASYFGRVSVSKP